MQANTADVIGRVTGLDPITTLVKWFPSEGTIFNRPVEGLYLLTGLPLATDETLKPLDFDIEDVNLFPQFMRKIYSTYDSKSPQREEWKDWYHTHIPQSASGVEYISNHIYASPLISYLACDMTASKQSSIWASDGSLKPQDNSFKWPELVAVCNPSVSTSFTPNPPDPRSYAFTDSCDTSYEYYKNATLDHYNKELNAMTNEGLKSILKQRITSTGSSLPFNGTKSVLIDRILGNDWSYFAANFRALSEADLRTVQGLKGYDEGDIAKFVNPSIVTFSEPFTVFNKLISLLQSRECRYNESSLEISRSNYIRPKTFISNSKYDIQQPAFTESLSGYANIIVPCTLKRAILRFNTGNLKGYVYQFNDDSVTIDWKAWVIKIRGHDTDFSKWKFSTVNCASMKMDLIQVYLISLCDMFCMNMPTSMLNEDYLTYYKSNLLLCLACDEFLM